HCLLNGLDSIGLTLQHADAITRYEQAQPAFLREWVMGESGRTVADSPCTG
ncbi:MAG: hypothetical protein ACRC60_01895, partial [Plesiomonas shigelloides]